MELFDEGFDNKGKTWRIQMLKLSDTSQVYNIIDPRDSFMNIPCADLNSAFKLRDALEQYAV